MAGNKINWGAKVSGSTILEVVISMVIILIVFGIAMMISANVMRSSLSVKKIKATALLHEVLQKAEVNKDNGTQTFTVDDFSIEQEIKSYNGNAELIDVHLTAYDDNHVKVVEIEKVIPNKNE